MICDALRGGPAAKFKLLIRCANCYRTSERELVVPEVEDAPRDVDELLESAYLSNQRFACSCGGTIGTVAAASLSTAGP